VYVDVSRFAADSHHFAQRLLHDAGVCVVPGADFGTAQARRYARVSYATAFENLEEAVRRIERFLADL
jgi:aspartate/methionine/tyrosine aminotransferase